MSRLKEIAVPKIKTIFLFTIFALIIPTSVMAEGFADLYIGFSQSQEQDLTITIADTPSDEKGEFEGNIACGYRIGYWFEPTPFGIALEISYFTQDIEDVADLSIIPISSLMMLRIPLLKSSEFPSGKWQPYAGVGPSFFLSRVKTEASDKKYNESDFGLDVRGGLKMYFVRNFGLFLEYRYTHFLPEFDPAIEEFDLETHHALLGITINF
jgi:hypothetical protein